MRFDQYNPFRKKGYRLASLLLVGLLILTSTGLASAAPNFGTFPPKELAHKNIDEYVWWNPQTLPHPQAESAIDPDPTIQGIIDGIDTTNVYSLTGDLTGEWPVTVGGDPYTITTRSTRYITPTEQVTQFAYEYFDDLGLEVAYHYYDHIFYGERRNVIAAQVGVGQPDRIFMITAHLDDAPASPIAPGADDNASGSVAVMLAAQMLSQYQFDCTLRYALFTGEEQGLRGSYQYAQDALQAGDDIEAALNLDMIAYESDGLPILDLHTRVANSGDLTIANTFVDVISSYNLGLTPHIHQDAMGRSDHVSFWQAGFPAILAIEDDDDFTPYYHTTGDKLETLNLDYFTDFIKAAVGTFSHLGCMLGTFSGRVTDIYSGLPLSGATVEALVDGSVIQGTTTTPDGLYRMDLPLDSYTLRASQPGYIPHSIPDVTVQGALTTTLDIPLEAYVPIPSADFVFQPQPAQVGEPVVFTGTVSGGTPPIEYTWDFGDGNLGDGQVVEHIFGLDDTYTVVMTATNGAGSITAMLDVVVEGSCIPMDGLGFFFAPESPMTGDAVIFTATVPTGTQPFYFDWNFGDSTISFGSVVTHTFPSALTASAYTVTLMGNNLCSLPQSVEKIVIVEPYRFFLPVLSNYAP